MADNPRTDSFRTELLSPEGVAAGRDGMVSKVPSWRLNMDEFHLPATNKRSHHGIVYYWKSWSKLFKCILLSFLVTSVPSTEKLEFWR